MQRIKVFLVSLSGINENSLLGIQFGALKRSLTNGNRGDANNRGLLLGLIGLVLHELMLLVLVLLLLHVLLVVLLLLNHGSLTHHHRLLLLLLLLAPRVHGLRDQLLLLAGRRASDELLLLRGLVMMMHGIHRGRCL